MHFETGLLNPNTFILGDLKTTFFPDLEQIKEAAKTTQHNCIWHFSQEDKIPHSPIQWREIKDNTKRNTQREIRIKFCK